MFVHVFSYFLWGILVDTGELFLGWQVQFLSKDRLGGGSRKGKGALDELRNRWLFVTQGGNIFIYQFFPICQIIFFNYLKL